MEAREVREMKRNNKRGSATVWIVILLLAGIAAVALIAKLNWERFKVETAYAFTLVGIALGLLLLIYIVIRIKIRMVKKERLKAQAAREAAEEAARAEASREE